jgi:hypothetical protein
MGKKKRNNPSGGIVYYKKRGLTKSLIIHVSADLYNDLKAIAAYDENSLQVIARRALRDTVQKRMEHIQVMKGKSHL